MIYYCSALSEMTEVQEHLFLDKTPAFRREKALRYHFRADRVRSLTGFALLCVGLGTVPSAFEENEFGKPCLMEGTPKFCLTHADGMAAAAIDGQDIGVDAEALRPPPTLVMRRVFTPTEIAQIESSRCPDHTFFIFWTLKESYCKAIGRGLSFPLQDVSFTLSPNGASPRPSSSDKNSLAKDLTAIPHNHISCTDNRFVFATHTLAGHQLSVCSKSAQEVAEISIRELLERYQACPSKNSK